jgi:hypothetical protein
MREKVYSGEWTLWRLLPPAQGVAVTYPDSGRLFIYYLHGRDFFDTLTREDLLQLAADEGCIGIWAEVTHKATYKLIKKRFGCESYMEGPGWWCVELHNGQQ